MDIRLGHNCNKTPHGATSCETWPLDYFEANTEPNERLIDELHQYGRENLALIHVMIQSPYVTKIKRDVSMTLTEYVANTGQRIS